MIDVSVITVSHESKEWIADQILSVMASAILVSYEEIIIDNGSKDGTAAWIEKGYSSYVRLIKNQKNMGFAAANQQGVAVARGRYLLFLNPDMRMELGALDRIVQWMDSHPDVGIAGCKLLDQEGSPHPALQPRRFPPCLLHLAYFFKLKKFFPRLESYFCYVPFDFEKEQEVDSVRGAFMLVRKEVIKKLGRAFDSRYFLLIEDLDFCQEVWKLGYRVVYTPVIWCTDLFHRSFLHHSRAWKHWQMCKSLWVYGSKWHTFWERMAILIAIPFSFLFHCPSWIRSRKIL